VRAAEGAGSARPGSGSLASRRLPGPAIANPPDYKPVARRRACSTLARMQLGGGQPGRVLPVDAGASHQEDWDALGQAYGW
jgi:hypothetical protein